MKQKVFVSMLTHHGFAAQRPCNEAHLQFANSKLPKRKGHAWVRAQRKMKDTQK